MKAFTILWTNFKAEIINLNSVGKHTQGCATADPGLQSRHPIRGVAKSLKYSYSNYILSLLQLSHPGVKKFG